MNACANMEYRAPQQQNQQIAKTKDIEYLSIDRNSVQSRIIEVITHRSEELGHRSTSAQFQKMKQNFNTRREALTREFEEFAALP